jgi:hypothetical protein
MPRRAPQLSTHAKVRSGSIGPVHAPDERTSTQHCERPGERRSANCRQCRLSSCDRTVSGLFSCAVGDAFWPSLCRSSAFFVTNQSSSDRACYCRAIGAHAHHCHLYDASKLANRPTTRDRNEFLHDLGRWLPVAHEFKPTSSDNACLTRSRLRHPILAVGRHPQMGPRGRLRWWLRAPSASRALAVLTGASFLPSWLS